MPAGLAVRALQGVQGHGRVGRGQVDRRRRHRQEDRRIITYVEWGFATENDLGVAAIDFGAGPVALTAESAAKALDAVTFTEPDSKNLVVDADVFSSKAPGAYPADPHAIPVVCSAGYPDAQTAPALREAFTTILADGQKASPTSATHCRSRRATARGYRRRSTP